MALPLLWSYQQRYAGFRPFQICAIVPPTDAALDHPLSADWLERHPAMRDERCRPMFLLVWARRP